MKIEKENVQFFYFELEQSSGGICKEFSLR